MTAVRGVGLGLRWDFVDALVQATADAEAGVAPRPAIDFLEVAPENYLGRGGKHVRQLHWLADRYPLVTHGLTMSLGGSDPLDPDYLRDVAVLLGTLGTPWHSDHLCLGAVEGVALHELLPVPFKRATAARVARRVEEARGAIRLPLAVENISYYWHPGRAEMSEPEFLTEVCSAADCGLLLDVNNAYVNATNFGFDAGDWLDAAPLGRVVQIHVAGHEWFGVTGEGLGPPQPAGSGGAVIVDTHGADVPDPVLACLARALAATGPVPVLLERDQNVPSFGALLEELGRVRAVVDRVARAGGEGSGGARSQHDAA